MTEDHAFESGGAFGRCAVCNRRKASHKAPAKPGLTQNLEAPTFDPPPPTPMPGPEVAEAMDLHQRTIPPNANFFSEPLEPLETASIPVLIHRKRVGLGSGTDAPKEATWPSGWRLPQAGDSILIDGAAGSVTDVRFDLDRGRIIISIR